ncbi:MAG: LapA family protein [Deltaproteobacteria bacterium]|nr:LapA family protein [Deltaproteobacteria bacterium]
MGVIKISTLLLSGAVLGLAAFEFIRENSEPAILDFWILRSRPMPLGAAILLALVAGIAVGLIALLTQWLRHKGRVKKLRNKIKALEMEITRTRNLALTGEVVPVSDLAANQPVLHQESGRDGGEQS